MYNLDEILDEVREKYYSSQYLNRPTISWTDKYVTDIFGMYNFFNNHIYISRILASDDISREMLSSVVYHESLHQDFQHHDEEFYKMATLFPDYEKYEPQLDDYAASFHNNMKFDTICNEFTKGKERVVYVVITSPDDYPSKFTDRGKAIILDTEVKVNFDIPNDGKTLFVFLGKHENNYYIVGWCTDGVLLKKRKKVYHYKYDDYDFCYQFESDYHNTYIVPMLCCDYSIEETLLPVELVENGSYMFSERDEEIQPDLAYIDSYCDGLFKLGMNPKNIDCISDFKDISVMKKMKSSGFRKVWHTNAIYQKQPTVKNLINRAVARYESWLLEASLEDFILANKLEPDNIDTAYDIIKISVLLSRYDIGKKYMDIYKAKLPKNNKVLERLYKKIESNTR